MSSRMYAADRPTAQSRNCARQSPPRRLTGQYKVRPGTGPGQLGAADRLASERGRTTKKVALCRFSGAWRDARKRRRPPFRHRGDKVGKPVREGKLHFLGNRRRAEDRCNEIERFRLHLHTHWESTMNGTMPSHVTGAFADELRALKNEWFWFLALGIGLIAFPL